MSNPALGAGSDLDGHHDALSTEGGMYIQVVPLGQPYMGYHCPLKCGSIVGGGLPGRNRIFRKLDLQMSTYAWNWN